MYFIALTFWGLFCLIVFLCGGLTDIDFHMHKKKDMDIRFVIVFGFTIIFVLIFCTDRPDVIKLTFGMIIIHLGLYSIIVAISKNSLKKKFIHALKVTDNYEDAANMLGITIEEVNNRKQFFKLGVKEEYNIEGEQDCRDHYKILHKSDSGTYLAQLPLIDFKPPNNDIIKSIALHISAKFMINVENLKLLIFLPEMDINKSEYASFSNIEIKINNDSLKGTKYEEYLQN